MKEHVEGQIIQYDDAVVSINGTCEKLDNSCALTREINLCTQIYVMRFCAFIDT